MLRPVLWPVQESRSVAHEVQGTHLSAEVNTSLVQPHVAVTHKRPADTGNGCHEEDRPLHLDKKIKVEVQ